MSYVWTCKLEEQIQLQNILSKFIFLKSNFRDKPLITTIDCQHRITIMNDKLILKDRQEFFKKTLGKFCLQPQLKIPNFWLLSWHHLVCSIPGLDPRHQGFPCWPSTGSPTASEQDSNLPFCLGLHKSPENKSVLRKCLYSCDFDGS